MLGRSRIIRTPGRGSRSAVRSASLVMTVAVGVGAGIALANPSAAESVRSRTSYVPSSVDGWRNDTTLGRTGQPDQYAQASVSGLRDSRYGAGFRLRYAGRGSQVLVAVSGTGWLIQPTGGPAFSGTFRHSSSGVLRAEIEGRTVRIRWNGTLMASREINGSYPGRHVVTTVRQPVQGVAVRSIRASSLPQRRVTNPDPPAVITGGGTWMSGAAGDEAADGRYAAWRGSPIGIGGTWTDTFEAQTDQWMICGGPWSTWNRPLDLAVGAIFHDRGETWAAAAKGAYAVRWTTALGRIKSCWGDRDPAKLYLRFAHEMNLQSIPWSVRHGEEKDFVAAMRLFSELRNTIIPTAHLVFSPNDGTDSSLGGLDIRNLWPGNDSSGRRVADVYAVDSYNWYPHVTTATAFATKINSSYPNGAPRGIERHRQLAAKFGVPFAVSEWSNSGRATSAGGGGESEAYIRLFNSWARQHSGDLRHPQPGQLIYEIHFNLWTEFSFWPRTVQPRTAQAYRSVAWGR